jgi:putative hemolysin
MSLQARQESYFDTESYRTRAQHKLRIGLAVHAEDVRAAQRLRHQVFIEEMGARLHPDEPGIESDRFDPYCQHLLVRDAANDQVVGCYRILTDAQATRAGGYYAQTEFDLTRVLAIPGRLIEVGRTCVHPDYRQGAVIGLLWSGLARFMLMHRYDTLMGCASVPLNGDAGQVGALWQTLATKYLSAPEWRVFPKTPFAALPESVSSVTVALPPPIKGYLRLGAQVCGEPAWDPVFNVADLFMLLSLDRLNARPARHFMHRA